VVGRRVGGGGWASAGRRAGGEEEGRPEEGAAREGRASARREEAGRDRSSTGARASSRRCRFVRDSTWSGAREERERAGRRGGKGGERVAGLCATRAARAPGRARGEGAGHLEGARSPDSADDGVLSALARDEALEHAVVLLAAVQEEVPELLRVHVLHDHVLRLVVLVLPVDVDVRAAHRVVRVALSQLRAETGLNPVHRQLRALVRRPHGPVLGRVQRGRALVAEHNSVRYGHG
jgi:hypothetical protein